MKKAHSAPENTFISIYILYLRGLITESNEPPKSRENMSSIIEALRSSSFENIKVCITTLKNTLCDNNVVEKLRKFE